MKKTTLMLFASCLISSALSADSSDNDIYLKAYQNNRLNDIGEAYIKGQTVIKNYKKAQELFNKACNLGDSKGCTNLGILYLSGKGGVEQNRQKAYELFSYACNSGYEIACYNIDLL
jgi:TPR repeat protein